MFHDSLRLQNYCRLLHRCGLSPGHLRFDFGAVPSAIGEPFYYLLSLTNDPAQGAVATLCVTNPTDLSLFYFAGPPQINSDQGWSPSWTPRGAGGTTLPAHQSSTFMARVPLSGDLWRVPVVWGYLPAGLERFRGLVRYNLRLNWHLLRHGRSPKLVNSPEFDLCMSYSPEVTNQIAEPKGPANGSQPIRSQTNGTSSAAGSRR